jgi:hypothetical protein
LQDRRPPSAIAHQQPNWFFCNGFVCDQANPDRASPTTMLKRLDDAQVSQWAASPAARTSTRER